MGLGIGLIRFSCLSSNPEEICGGGEGAVPPYTYANTKHCRQASVMVGVLLLVKDTAQTVCV